MPGSEKCLSRQGEGPILEWMEFLSKDVELHLKVIVEAMQHTITGTLLVKSASQELYLDILRKVEAGVTWSKYGSQVYGWLAGEEVSSVQLHNVMKADLEAAVQVLTQFGTVLSRVVHVYKEIPTMKNGVVTSKMRLRAQVELPVYIYDGKAGSTIQVFSDKQQGVCYRCLRKGHIAAFCRKALKTQATASGTKSWASIAAAPPMIPTPDQIVPPPGRSNWSKRGRSGQCTKSKSWSSRASRCWED